MSADLAKRMDAVWTLDVEIAAAPVSFTGTCAIAASVEYAPRVNAAMTAAAPIGNHACRIEIEQ